MFLRVMFIVMDVLLTYGYAQNFQRNPFADPITYSRDIYRDINKNKKEKCILKKTVLLNIIIFIKYN